MIQVAVGDIIGVISTGEIDFGGAVVGFGAPILNADGDNAPTPSNYPAPSLRKNSLICQIGSTFFQGGVATLFTSTATGELILNVNDATPQDNSRGWTVYVYQTPPGAPLPLVGSWHKFETVAGDGGISPAVLFFLGREHVFHHDEKKLWHYVRDSFGHQTNTILDGDGGTLGQTKGAISQKVSAVEFAGTINVFYFDSTAKTLRRAFGDGVTMGFQVLDGAGGTMGEITGTVGYWNSAIVYQNKLHVFYLGGTDQALGPGPDGSGVVTGHLRHATFDGVSFTFEVLDGAGGPDGRVAAFVGLGISAVTDSNDVLHVFYRDQTNTNLRHARFDGQKWRFAVFDGGSDPNPMDAATGQTKADVGRYPTSVLLLDEVNVFYHDLTFGNVRVASRRPTGNWTLEKLDGGGGHNGRTKHTVGDRLMTAVKLADHLSLFYYDSDDGNLRHAWKEFGSNWVFETLDGAGGPDGRIDANVGGTVGATTVPIATAPGTMMSVYYWDEDNKDLRRVSFF
jgi:hypothetical protein